MQSVSFPISFPAYAYKVAHATSEGQRWRYGALAPDLGQLTVEFSDLAALAADVVKELFQLRELPDTEEVPDSFCDLSDEEWDELNGLIELRTNGSEEVQMRTGSTD